MQYLRHQSIFVSLLAVYMYYECSELPLGTKRGLSITSVTSSVMKICCAQNHKGNRNHVPFSIRNHCRSDEYGVIKKDCLSHCLAGSSRQNPSTQMNLTYRTLFLISCIWQRRKYDNSLCYSVWWVFECKILKGHTLIWLLFSSSYFNYMY